MKEMLFPIERDEGRTLQSQIREELERAVASGRFMPGDPAPSTRRLSQSLGVSRNTVSIAYQVLVDQGVLEARERSGYYIARQSASTVSPARAPEAQIEWSSRLTARPSGFEPVPRPHDWRAAPFPFIYGQFDPTLFPISEWRDATRKAMGRRWLEDWTEDRYVDDDPMLVDQIRRRLLPRRGVAAEAEEILITLGGQNAIYLASELLIPHGAPAVVEDPCYPDARAIMGARTANLRAQPVDEEGMLVDDRLEGARMIYVTPSHHYPSMVTMSLSRRAALLKAAERYDSLILEDDYEPEANAVAAPQPALRALDRRGRVIYAGSLSKSIMPGLRLGYLVGAPEFIQEARALRRMLLRHPPGMNQRVAAIFMAARHHDMLLGRIRRAMAARRAAALAALAAHAPDWRVSGAHGGGGLWVECSDGIDTRDLAAEAIKDGVMIEPGDVCFATAPRPRRFFRLGLSVIQDTKVDDGVRLLALAAKRL